MSNECLSSEFLAYQQAWSFKTFGPADLRGPLGPLDHIKKEILEIEADPYDVMEWVDIMILAMDGAMRAGWTPNQILVRYKDKVLTNMNRKWPDWSTAEPNTAIEHIRDGE